MVCGSAGTFTIGQKGFNTQSNDLALDTIYLCFGDSIFINHNNDSDLSGDPEPATQPGVAWPFYGCPPTIVGDNLQTVITDPCIKLSIVSGLPDVAFGDPTGDIWFFNSGFLQTKYNSGQPVLLHFAPITVDDFTGKAYESAQVGFPPGPCVNVNTAAQFEVVYLNAITAEGLTNAAGNDCLGRFVVKGGFPQYDKNETYDIDIFLTSDPSVKALIYTSVPQYKNGTPILFSVTTPGQYTIVIEDGKSCGFRGTVDMFGCNSMDNVVINFPDTIVPPGAQICVPITVNNFTNLVTTTFMMEWDETILQYTGVQKPHPSTMFSLASNLNDQLVGDGKLGLIIFKNNGTPISIPNDGTLIEVCFNAIGPLGSCTALDVTNDPSQMGAETASSSVAMTIDTGSVCIQYFPLVLLDSIKNPTCNGFATLEVTATGGLEPYEVTWIPVNGGATTIGNIAMDGGKYISPAQLPNGDYRVCLQDDNGNGTLVCDTITVDIQILGVNLTFGLPKCNGDSTGTVTANVLVGSSPAPDPTAFTYDWTGPVPLVPDVPVQTNVPAGPYSVTVTDKANNCFVVASGSLAQPFAISDNGITVTPASCSGVDDGTISYIAQGGTPFPGTTYDFNWEFSANGNPPFTPVLQEQTNPSVLTGRPAGVHRFTITDANGCTHTGQVTITNQRTVSIDVVAVVGTSCAGGSDGSISISTSSTPPVPNPTYSFFWTNGTPTSTATTSQVAGLSAGTYGLLAIDASGCSDTATFVVMSPAPVKLDTVELINPSCTLLNDGKITVIATGGIPAAQGQYAIFWNSPLPPGATQMNLTAGTYSVTVEDSKLCRDSLVFTLALPPAPVITQVDSTSIKCGADGCLEVATSATGATFAWQILGSTIVFGTTAKVCTLTGGVYVVTVKDANNCVTSDTIPLGTIVPLEIDTATLNKPNCAGDANGSIIPTILGGQPAYLYAWTPTSSQPALIGIKAGSYVLTVTDQKGCTVTETFILLDPPAIIASYANATSATCADACDGGATIVVNYSDGTTGNFNFLWSDNGASDSIRTDLCAGTHTVIVTDGNNCFAEVSVITGAPLPIDTAFAMVAANCNGGDDGSLTVTPSGGTGPFQFKWSNNPSVTPKASNLEAGFYTVTITDSKGCTAEFSKEVTQPLPIVVQPDAMFISKPKCFNNLDGTVAVTVSGGNGGYSFGWKDANGTNIGNTNPLSDLGAGIYTVTVFDSKECTGTATIGLENPEPVLGSYKPYEPLLCNGDETILIIETITGGAGGPYQFSIDNGATLNPDFPVTVGGGEHIVTYLDRIGCEFTEMINIPEPAPIVITFNPATIEIELGDTTQQLLPIITGTTVDSFIWTPAQFISDPKSLTPYITTFKSQVYTLTVFDANGCTGTGKIVVTVDPNRNVYIPNAFIPGNADGRNFFFAPIGGNGVKDVNYFQVYNRWGELMYERTNFEIGTDEFGVGWDGRFKGQFVQPGVYVYVVEADFLDGRTLLYRGDVTVIR